MKEVYYNGHNVPPTWRNIGVEMKVDGKYIPLPSETHVMVSDEDFEFCNRIALKYGLNLNEFCALVDYAKNSKRDIKRRKAYHPLSEMLINGGEIKEISVTTTKGTAKLIDPYFFFQITRAYRVHRQSEITLRGLLAALHSYLDNQRKGPSRRRIIIGLICQYLNIYVKKPLLSEAEWKAAEKRGDRGTAAATWEKYLESNIKSWIKDFDW